jgi:hypothetical protein
MSNSTPAVGAVNPGAIVRDGSLLRGTTRAAYGNPHHSLTLAGATLVFYAAEAVATRAESRWGFTEADPARAPGKELARARVQDDGSYGAVLPASFDGAVLVAIDVERFSYAPATGKRAFGLLGAAAPRWEGEQGARHAHLEIDLSHHAYCSILSLLDLWLVGGRVAACDSGQGMPGGKVEAFDRDLSQDDFLGSDTTDGGGNFQIFFQPSAFKGIPVLPPPFDVIPPHELIGGPDVFFRVTHSGNTLIEESPGAGRGAGRENVGRCSYHELCVKEITPPKADTITLWTRIGGYKVPNTTGLNDFDADGLTAAGKLAFSGDIPFYGLVAQQYAGEAVSYRFTWAEWPNLATAPADAAFQPLTAAHINTGVPYGSILVDTGPEPWDYDTTYVYPEPDADGWIAVSQHPDFVRDGWPMLQVRTDVLVPAVGSHGEMESTFDAGQPVPVGPLRDRPRKFSFKMQMKTASNFEVQPVAVPIHINNSPAYLRFELGELAGNACAELVTPPMGMPLHIHPQWTVAHPYLHDFGVNLHRQGGAHVNHGEDFNEPGNGVLWTSAAGETSPAGFELLYSDTGSCSYRCSITAHRRLTSGWGQNGTQQHILRTFCVD